MAAKSIYASIRQLRVAIAQAMHRVDDGSLSPLSENVEGPCGHEVGEVGMLQLAKLDDIIRSDATRFASIVELNRLTLRQGPDWCRPAELKGAYWRYGVVQAAEAGLNAVAPEPTYCDLVQYLATQIEASTKYLEIGVSVGKGFLQHAKAWSDALLVGVDIEEMSTPLRESLRIPHDLLPQPWGTTQLFHQGKNPHLKCPSTMNFVDERNNKIEYYSTDKFDEDTWSRLSKHKFNVIFSDAFHKPESIMHEVCMLVKYDLIDRGEFVIVWDDISQDMARAMRQIVKALRYLYGIDPRDTALVIILGTYGGKNGTTPHRVGIVAKLRTRTLLQ